MDMGLGLDVPQMIQWMIIICLGGLALVTLAKPLKWLIKVLIQGGIGTVGIVVVNSLLSMLGVGISVGINLLSVATVAVLGLPGMVLLYAMAFIL